MNVYVYDLIRALFQLKEYDEVLTKLQKYGYDINIKRSIDDDTTLGSIATDVLDAEGLEFCIRHGYVGTGRVTRRLLSRYERAPETVLRLIDMFMGTGVETWDLYHYSLIWNVLDVHKYMLSKWRSRLDFSALPASLIIVGRRGHYNVLKYVMTEPLYEGLVSLHDVLNEALSVNICCDGERFRLIEYLVRDLGIRHKGLQDKIDNFLDTYNAESLDKNEYDVYPEGYVRGLDEEENDIRAFRDAWIEKNHVYMPDVFKAVKNDFPATSISSHK